MEGKCLIRGVRIEFPNATRTCSDSPCNLPFLCCSLVRRWQRGDILVTWWYDVSLLPGGRARVGQAHECWMMLDVFDTCASCVSCLAMNMETQMLPMFLGFCKHLVSLYLGIRNLSGSESSMLNSITETEEMQTSGSTPYYSSHWSYPMICRKMLRVETATAVE